MISPKIKPTSAQDMFIPHRYSTQASKTPSIILQRVNPLTHSLPRVPVVNNVYKGVQNNINTEVTYNYKMHIGEIKNLHNHSKF